MIALIRRIFCIYDATFAGGKIVGLSYNPVFTHTCFPTLMAFQFTSCQGVIPLNIFTHGRNKKRFTMWALLIAGLDFEHCRRT